MLTPITVVIQILSGLGLIAAASAYIRHFFERRCWRNYKMRVDDWIDRLEKSAGRHPKEIDEHDWRVECERMLYDSNFRPSQIQQLLDTSVIVAKGIAADRVLL